MKPMHVMAVSAAVGLIGSVLFAQSAYPPLEILLTSEKTIIGQEFTYPEGRPKVTAAIVTMEPGASTGWHHHDVPLFAWVLEGEFTVDYGADGLKTYRKGDAFLEAFQSDHDGANTGSVPARVLAVFMGAEDARNTKLQAP